MEVRHDWGVAFCVSVAKDMCKDVSNCDYWEASCSDSFHVAIALACRGLCLRSLNVLPGLTSNKRVVVGGRTVAQLGG